MMKKLLVLTAVVTLTAGTLGCQCCDWFRRGAYCPPATPETTLYDPCPPANPCDPCDPCAPGTFSTSPSPVLPGPGPLP